MNFERFTNRVKASAAAAASAAREFKGFDDMAANDEYIHSEDLNVRNRSHDGDRGQSRVESLEENPLLHHADDHQHHPGQHGSPLSPSSPFPQTSQSPMVPYPSSRQEKPKTLAETGRSATMPEYCSKTPPPSTNRAQRQQEKTPLLDIVADTLNNSTLKSLKSNMSDTDTASSAALPVSSTLEDDSDEDDDPIFAILKKGGTPLRRDHDRNEDRSRYSGQRSQMTPMEIEEGGQYKGKASRFMDDLDDRISRPNPPSATASVASLDSTLTDGTENRNIIQEPAKTVTTAAVSWIRGIANRSQNRNDTSGKSQSPKIRSPPPLARQKRKPAGGMQDESFDVVVSSAVLADDELRQLQELKQSSQLATTQTNLICRLFGLIRQHPREAFIVLTLILGILAYLYSQAMSTEDNVTR